MDMKAIGKKISKNRKKRDWTQRQLAKQLSVSHQAVSKWEKGAAIPDLETLVAMARLFGVSVDQLIAPKADVPNPTSQAFLEEELEDEDEMFELGEDESDDMDMGDENGEHHHHTSEEIDPKLKMFFEIAPFVSRDILDQKFLSYLERNDLPSFTAIERLAPFVSKETLGEAINKVVNEEVDPKIITQLAPFLSKSDLMKLMDQMKDTEWISNNFGRLAPFLPKEYLDDLFSKLDF